MKRKILFFIGIVIIIILLASYFINLNIENGSNYKIQSSLLGIIIFYNPFILGLYILIAIILIVKGIKN
ncbi:MAG: hypothetical protein AABX83_01570 [Nanoarchaeota archaeon]